MKQGSNAKSNSKESGKKPSIVVVEPEEVLYDATKEIQKNKEKYEVLFVERDKLEQKVKKVQEDKQNALSYLEETVKMLTRENGQLKDWVDEMQRDRAKEARNFKLMLYDKENELSGTIEKLETENKVLVSRSHVISEFQKERLEFLAQLEKLESDIDQKNVNWNEKTLETQRNAIINRERLENELVERVNDLAIHYHSQFNGKIDDKTKQIMQENEELRKSARQLKLQMEKIQTENDNLSYDNKSQRSDIKSLKHELQFSGSRNSRLSNLKALHEPTILDTKLAEASRQLVDLRLQLETVEKENNTAKKEIQELRSANEKCCFVIQTLEATSKEREKKYRTSLTNFMKMAAEIKLAVENLASDEDHGEADEEFLFAKIFEVIHQNQEAAKLLDD